MNSSEIPWILAIEDSDNDLYLLQRVLDESPGPKRVVRARDGEQAMLLIQELAAGGSEALPDIIIIDLNMPRVDGFEVLEQLVSQRAFRTVPVVVVTSSQDEGDRQLARASGADGYFIKPLEVVRYKELLKIMDQARSLRSHKIGASFCG